MTLLHTNQPARIAGSTSINWIGTRVFAMVSELRARMEIMHGFGKLSPQELRDIGLTQNDVEAACSNRLSQEASTELQCATLERSGNW